MNKRLKTTILCLIVVGISISLLLIYLFVPSRKNIDLSLKTPLSSSATDISLSVGNKIYDYYEISDKSAMISFEVSQKNIINIDENMIEGLKEGSVNVVMTAQKENEISKTSFNVVVYQKSCLINILPISDCDFNDETLIVSSNVCQFQLEVYDLQNNKLENVQMQVFTNGDAIIEKNFLTIMLCVTKDCVITFNFPELDECFSICVEYRI